MRAASGVLRAKPPVRRFDIEGVLLGERFGHEDALDDFGVAFGLVPLAFLSEADIATTSKARCNEKTQATDVYIAEENETRECRVRSGGARERCAGDPSPAQREREIETRSVGEKEKERESEREREREIERARERE